MMMCVWGGGGWGVLFFFFSSRRRHTRYWRDWSSDVCSSDLNSSGTTWANETHRLRCEFPDSFEVKGDTTVPKEIRCFINALHGDLYLFRDRSEERRVGKECRSRWSPYH